MKVVKRFELGFQAVVTVPECHHKFMYCIASCVALMLTITLGGLVKIHLTVQNELSSVTIYSFMR